jgi:hypothetical protein
MLRSCLVALALLFAWPKGEAWAEKRVALVIGNGAYAHVTALANPPNDASDVAKALANLGFETISVINGDHRAMLDGLSRFGRAAGNADTALFFYAGHGLQVAGRNYLVPVSARLQQETDLATEAIRVDDVMEIMDTAGARMKLVFLDACRDNPLARSLSRSASRGLAPPNFKPAGTLIAFSTAPGDVASDGTGRNSPFTQGLLAHLADPGVEVRQMLGRVRAAVYQATDQKQLPWVNESLIGEFYFAGAAAGAPPAPGPSAGGADPGFAALQKEIEQLRKDLARNPPAPPRQGDLQASNPQMAALPPPPQRDLGFIFPDSDRRYLAEAELRGLSREQLRIARNEIYARRGRYFQSPDLTRYFSRYPWYRPHSWDPPLNPYERANAELLKRAEDRR